MEGFVVIKYYPNRDIEEMHEFVTICKSGEELDKTVLELEKEQEKIFTYEDEYFDIITLSLDYGEVL
jgi:hypothetical protein